MGTSTSTSGLKLLQVQKKPLVIHSVDGEIIGSILLQNDSDSKVRLKSMPITAPELKTRTQEPVSEARLFGKLYPNERGDIAFNIPIDPTTPPGTYKANFAVGGATQDVEVVVIEHLDMEVMPDSIVIQVTKEKNHQVDKSFKFINLGNTDVTINGAWPFSLQSHQDMDVVLLNLLQNSCNEKRGSKDDGSTRELICNMVNKYPKQGKIDFTKGVTVKAGEEVDINSTIHLPDDMQTNMHYFAAVDVFGANILFDIYSLS